MSFSVRDINDTLGPLAQVEFPNGAGAPTLGCVQAWEDAGIYGAAGGTTFPAGVVAGTTYTVFMSPPTPSISLGQPPLGGNWVVKEASIFYSTAASGAATVAIEVCAPGTANGSGTNVLSATNFALNTALSTANTPQTLPLSTNIDNLTLVPNSRINFIFGATSTAGLVDFTLILYLVRVS
jgi:hypothetical protein